MSRRQLYFSSLFVSRVPLKLRRRYHSLTAAGNLHIGSFKSGKFKSNKIYELYLQLSIAVVQSE